MEQPILKIIKNAEQTTNKIRVPKNVIDTMGNKFYMEIYEDKIILKPIKKGE